MGEKYNILVLFSDQFRFDAMGCAGNEIIQTPNLDGLAKSGCHFTNAFTPTPVCVPARLSFITGHRGSRIRFMRNGKLPGPEPALPTLMTCLHDVGYRTQAVGKMHFRGKYYGFHGIESQEECPDFRIDDDYLMFLKASNIRARFPHGYRNLLYFQPQTSAMPEEFSPEAWVADRSIHFLRDHLRYRGSKPFFLWSSWIAPHPPFAPCEPYASMYRSEDMEFPYGTQRPLSDLPASTWPHRARLDGAHHDPDRMRRIRALYYAKVTHADHCVGRVLRELDSLGLSENTIVIFTSDHGDMLGDHGLSQKNVPYEPSAHVPFIVRWPGVTRANTAKNDLINLIDVMPTLIDGLDLQYPKEYGPLPGSSLYSPEKLSSDRETVFVDYGYGRDRWVSVRDRTHKYAAWASGGREELYSMVDDPEEMHNLISSQPEKASELRALVVDWEKKYGLPDSLDGNRLRAFPEPEPPAEEDCRAVAINQGRWAENLPDDEKHTVESYEEAMSKALAKERFRLDNLSIKEYVEKTGNPIDKIYI
ncbi:sulfatase [Candidatus Poribacteria bacterium]